MQRHAEVDKIITVNPPDLTVLSEFSVQPWKLVNRKNDRLFVRAIRLITIFNDSSHLGCTLISGLRPRRNPLKHSCHKRFH